MTCTRIPVFFQTPTKITTNRLRRGLGQTCLTSPGRRTVEQEKGNYNRTILGSVWGVFTLCAALSPLNWPERTQAATTHCTCPTYISVCQFSFSLPFRPSFFLLLAIYLLFSPIRPCNLHGAAKISSGNARHVTGRSLPKPPLVEHVEQSTYIIWYRETRRLRPILIMGAHDSCSLKVFSQTATTAWAMTAGLRVRSTPCGHGGSAARCKQ